MRTIILYSILAIFAGCSSNRKTEETGSQTAPNSIQLNEEQNKNAGIETGPIKKHSLNTELQVNGIVDVPPQNIVSVSFPLGGYLKSTRLLPGLQVRKGEVIAMVEDQSLIQLQQDYLMTKANLDFIEKEFKRQELLNQNQVNSDKVYQKSKSDFEAQKILLKGYSEKLKLININPEKLTEESISRVVPLYSPINGFVSKVNINIGKYVNPTDVLFELINPEDIHAALTVFEKDLIQVKPGQKVWISFVDDPKTVYPCEVLLVSKNVDDNRAAQVHCHFEKQPSQLLPGMFLKARISIKDAEVLAVPEEAVVRIGTNEYVLEEKTKNFFELLMIETGITDKGMVEIRNEKSIEGKSIIMKNAYPVLAMLKNQQGS